MDRKEEINEKIKEIQKRREEKINQTEEMKTCKKCKNTIDSDSERCYRCGKIQKLGYKKIALYFLKYCISRLIILAIFGGIMYFLFLKFEDEINKVFEVIIKTIGWLFILFIIGLFG